MIDVLMALVLVIGILMVKYCIYIILLCGVHACTLQFILINNN